MGIRTRVQVILLLLAAMPPAHAELTGGETHCVREPVYQTRVCYHQLNREAKQTIVLVHGIGEAASDDWSEQWTMLGREYRVIAVDLPGYGSSDHAVKAYTPAGYAEVLDFVIRREAAGPINLVGHSMGGAIALRYAAAHPERLVRLVVIDAAGILYRLAVVKFLVGNRLAETSLIGRWSNRALESLTGKILEEFEGASPKPPDDVAKRLEQQDGMSVQRLNALTLVADDFSKPLAAVEAPTLLIWGEEDEVAPLRTGQVLLRRLKDVRLLVVPKTGHMPLKTHAMSVSLAILDFLEGREVAGSRREAPLPGQAGERIGYCERQRGVTFSGPYRSIELRHCGDVVLEGVVAERVTVFESRATIVNSRIESADTALEVTGSELKLTAVEIAGDVAIQADRSRLDLAAVDIRGETASIRSSQDSTVIFSVCRVNSPYWLGEIHGLRELNNEMPM